MGLLRFPGVFTMPVPDGWKGTSEQDGPFALTSPDGAAFIHLSTFDREGGEFAEDEARDLMGTFLTNANPAGEVDIQVSRERTEHRAIARFAGTGPQGEPLDWFATVILRRNHMLLCSCYADPGHPALAEAERMFGSITTDKKGWFRR